MIKIRYDTILNSKYIINIQHNIVTYLKSICNYIDRFFYLEIIINVIIDLKLNFEVVCLI